MASYRHLARTCIMQTLFAVEFNKNNDPKITMEEILEEFAPKLSETDFAYETLDGVLKHREEILNTIETYAPEWPVDKIARVDRVILEIGIYEIMYSQDVPPVVAINEAVEIAKHYGDKNSPKFVNGVLSSVMNKIKE